MEEGSTISGFPTDHKSPENNSLSNVISPVMSSLNCTNKGIFQQNTSKAGAPIVIPLQLKTKQDDKVSQKSINETSTDAGASPVKNRKKNRKNPKIASPSRNKGEDRALKGCPILLATRNALVKICAKRLGMKCLSWEDVDEGQAWNLAWIDPSEISSGTIKAMYYFQRINHIPGVQQVTGKKNLGRNLNRASKLFPGVFNKVYQKTFILPEELPAMKEYLAKRNRTVIVKPNGKSHGDGIFLTRNINDPQFDKNGLYVAQRYLQKPLLIDGLKFDLRVYGLVTSTAPPRVYVHRDGLVRFCTETYKPPQKDLANLYAHLTNYAINKNHENFQFNDSLENCGTGSKWTIKALGTWLDDKGIDFGKVWDSIKNAIALTMIAASATLSHEYKACFAQSKDSGMGFALLGYDILLDEKYRARILEVNRNPSLRCDTPLDTFVKTNVVSDTLRLVAPSGKSCRRDTSTFKRQSRRDLSRKMGKAPWSGQTPRGIKHSQLYKKRIAHERRRQRDTHWELLLPVEDLNQSNDHPSTAHSYEELIKKLQEEFQSRNMPKRIKLQQNLASNSDEQCTKKTPRIAKQRSYQRRSVKKGQTVSRLKPIVSSVSLRHEMAEAKRMRKYLKLCQRPRIYNLPKLFNPENRYFMMRPLKPSVFRFRPPEQPFHIIFNGDLRNLRRKIGEREKQRSR